MQSFATVPVIVRESIPRGYYEGDEPSSLKTETLRPISRTLRESTARSNYTKLRFDARGPEQGGTSSLRNVAFPISDANSLSGAQKRPRWRDGVLIFEIAASVRLIS